jgi:hypothetical protein
MKNQATSTPITYFNILHVTTPFESPTIVERHVFNMNEKVSMHTRTKKVLGEWMQKGDRLQMLDGAMIQHQGIDLEIVPVVINAYDGESIDIFGQWLMPA